MPWPLGVLQRLNFSVGMPQALILTASRLVTYKTALLVLHIGEFLARSSAVVRFVRVPDNFILAAYASRALDSASLRGHCRPNG